MGIFGWMMLWSGQGMSVQE
jgi:hypothetical protein